MLICSYQGRINHCAGCTMGRAPGRGGPRSTAEFFPRWFDVWTFSVGLKITTTTKKVTNFLTFLEERGIYIYPGDSPPTKYGLDKTLIAANQSTAYCRFIAEVASALETCSPAIVFDLVYLR